VSAKHKPLAYQGPWGPETVEARNVLGSRNKSSWKSVLQSIHGCLRCMECGNFPSGTMHFACIGSACRKPCYRARLRKFRRLLLQIRVSHSQRCEVRRRGTILHRTTLSSRQNELGPMHFRTIFLTIVAKFLPIYISRNTKLRFITIIYTFMMFAFEFCNSKASIQTPRIRTCNYSTLDSYASNKKLPTITRDLEESQAR
jgi:hypothetical protein